MYKWLFWILPLKRWQAFLIDFHFDKCHSCREESGVDDLFKQTQISPQDCLKLPTVWPGIKNMINREEQEKRRKKNFILLPRWKWALPVFGIICMVLLLPNLLQKKRIPSSSRTTDQKKNPMILLKSVKMENQPAKTFFFKSRHPDRLIVWVEKGDKE